jgi:SMC interacting uncharacterized protein involved in chromosome segregation
VGVVEETRQVVQDFLAPELRAISARLDALEKTVSANERHAEQRHDAVLQAIQQLSNYQVVIERLARFEAQTGVKAH